jgi:hypothetical protein
VELILATLASPEITAAAAPATIAFLDDPANVDVRKQIESAVLAQLMPEDAPTSGDGDDEKDAAAKEAAGAEVAA